MREDAPQRRRVEPAAAGRDEERVLRAPREGRPRLVQVARQQMAGFFSERNDALLAPLPAHMELLTVEVDVREVEPHRLRAAQPRGVHELDERAWTAMVEVDLNGAWRCAKAVLPDMLARQSGAIVNVASTAGLVAFPFFANYVAAKHGLIGLTRALALDYASHSIRVNAVCPTSIRDEPELDSVMLASVSCPRQVR